MVNRTKINKFSFSWDLGSEMEDLCRAIVSRSRRNVNVLRVEQNAGLLD